MYAIEKATLLQYSFNLFVCLFFSETQSNEAEDFDYCHFREPLFELSAEDN